MLPKLRLTGLAVSVPAAEVPVPLTATFNVEFAALLIIASVPLTVLADAGVNVTLNVVPWPAANVSGSVRPLVWNPVPEIVACVIVTEMSPEFVSVSETV